MTLTSTKSGLQAAGDLPVHPTMRHPHTGEPLRAIYRTKRGRLVWPQMGGSPDDPPPPPNPAEPPKPADPPADPPTPPEPPKPTDPKDEPLGPAGLRALQAEREAREKLEKEFAPLRPLLAALGGGKPADGKTELEQLNERFAAQEKAIADERVARWRAEVTAEKKLTPAQAKRLVGSTKEEMAADADDLLAAFPAPPPTDGKGRGGPRPDPAQGPRPGDKSTSVASGRDLYAERHKKKTTTST